MKLGLRGPDTPDDRDWIWSISRNLTLSESINLLSRCTRIEDQLNRGTCVLQAATSITEYNKKERDEIYAELSRLMGYYECRFMDGTDPDYDVGTYCRTAMKVLYQIGLCKESLWPYDVNKYHIRPTQDCYEDAANRRIKSYHRVISLFDMRACLAAGRPFMLGIPIFKSFMTDEVANTGDVPMPGFFESILGYHAIYCCGYNDFSRKVKCVNSWGIDWGDKGTFTLLYRYLEKYVIPQGMGDCWTVFR